MYTHGKKSGYHKVKVCLIFIIGNFAMEIKSEKWKNCEKLFVLFFGIDITEFVQLPQKTAFLLFCRKRNKKDKRKSNFVDNCLFTARMWINKTYKISYSQSYPQYPHGYARYPVWNTAVSRSKICFVIYDKSEQK